MEPSAVQSHLEPVHPIYISDPDPWSYEGPVHQAIHQLDKESGLVLPAPLQHHRSQLKGAELLKLKKDLAQ